MDLLQFYRLCSVTNRTTAGLIRRGLVVAMAGKFEMFGMLKTLEAWVPLLLLLVTVVVVVLGLVFSRGLIIIPTVAWTGDI